MTLRTPLCALFLLTATSCNKTVGDVVRPDDHTAAAATGAEMVCEGVPGRVKPLVVDWSADERVDLEAAMQGSVVVVKYDCPGIEILPGCTVEGSYAYAGVSRKEQVVQMTNMDEVRANIPMSSGSVGGEIQSGRAIDLATVLVGRRSTTVNYLTEGTLVGQCEGATHFVRSASLGAFSMGTGSVGNAAVMGEMFGVGASASSNSERNTTNTDGNLEACRDSKPGADTPPGECQAPVRIELMPIAKGELGAGNKEALEATKKPVADNPCLPGYVFAAGMCSRPSEDLATICEPGDESDCEAQCEKGSAESCLNLGRLLAEDRRSDHAMIPYKKACEAEQWEACTALGEKVYYDIDTEKPLSPETIKLAFDLLTLGCDGGHGYGCELRGDMLSDADLKMVDEGAAFSAYDRACDLGSSFGCHAAAERQLKGQGIPADVRAGLATLLRSCQGGSSDECWTMAGIFDEAKHGVPQDKDLAIKLYDLSCNMDWAYCQVGSEQVKALGGEARVLVTMLERDCAADKESTGCGRLAEFYASGEGVTQDEAKAKELFERGCNGGDDASCKVLGRPTPE